MSGRTRAFRERFPEAAAELKVKDIANCFEVAPDHVLLLCTAPIIPFRLYLSEGIVVRKSSLQKFFGMELVGCEQAIEEQGRKLKRPWTGRRALMQFWFQADLRHALFSRAAFETLEGMQSALGVSMGETIPVGDPCKEILEMEHLAMQATIRAAASRLRGLEIDSNQQLTQCRTKGYPGPGDAERDSRNDH